MSKNYCPECGADLYYDAAVRRYTCKSCGLYATKDEINNIKDRERDKTDSYRKKRKSQDEYLDWWLSKKK